MGNSVMIRIGYQGDIGSNSEEAAKQFSERAGFSQVELIPLISSQRVVDALVDHKIDYGVTAIQNSIGGVVIETARAIQGLNLVKLDRVILPIHHCLFKKRGIADEQLSTVASHIQALKQTRQTRKKHFPQLMELEVEDTAIAAKKLADGQYPDHYAVICRKNAGEQNDLELIAENIEDDMHNETEFAFFSL